jgi:dCMP deaminase
MIHAMPDPVKNHETKWLTSCEMLAPLFSTCAKRQYFAVVLSPNKRVVGIGYNGSPPGMEHCVDGACPRLHENSANGSSYDNCIAQHAEQGALLWSDPALRIGGTLIVNGPPCMGCAKLIASSGIVRLVYKPDTAYKGWHAVEDFLNSAGITCVKATPIT